MSISCTVTCFCQQLKQLQTGQKRNRCSAMKIPTHTVGTPPCPPAKPVSTERDAATHSAVGAATCSGSARRGRQHSWLGTGSGLWRSRRASRSPTRLHGFVLNGSHVEVAIRVAARAGGVARRGGAPVVVPQSLPAQRLPEPGGMRPPHQQGTCMQNQSWHRAVVHGQHASIPSLALQCSGFQSLTLSLLFSTLDSLLVSTQLYQPAQQP